MAAYCPPDDGRCLSKHVGHILKQITNWTVYLGGVSSHTAIQCRNAVLFIPARSNHMRTCSANGNTTNLSTLYDMIYMLTAIGLTAGGSSTLQYITVQYSTAQYSTQLHTNNTQNNTMKRNTQNGTYITIRIYKHNNLNT